MSEYNTVGLYDHNAKSYDKIKEGFNNSNVVAIVHATGTGKSFNAIQYAYDHKDEKIIYVVPYKSIIEHLQQVIESNPNLSMDDFKHVEFRTYSSFVRMDYYELEKLEVDTLILDEFHHIGAPVWGNRINNIIKTHPNIKVLGMTAYTVRDRGTSYEMDMVNPETEELFSNKVVSRYDLCDAFIDGVLPKPIYKSAYINLEDTLEKLKDRFNPNSDEYQKLVYLINDSRKRAHEAPSMVDVFKKHVKKDGKYIYFCPLISEQGVNDIETIQAETKKWLTEMGLGDDDYVIYTTTSEMGEDGKNNRNAFYCDLDLDGNDAKDKLRIMFAINQYNEGSHVPNIDGVIMGRGTKSDIVFFEQLGRALAVRGKNKEKFDLYNTKTTEELIEMCNARDIEIKSEYTKEDIIELLLAPTIIDLANNIDFIKELENNLKDRVKLMQQDYSTGKREIHLKNASFDIEMLNQDLFELVKYLRDSLTITWEDKYELAKAYYEYHGDLEIPTSFKTINGYEYDDNGIPLGTWIGNMRRAYQGKNKRIITQEQIELLSAIGMRWDNIDLMNNWMEKYELAKAYYEHYGNLNMPGGFKTKNGYEEDKEGFALRDWIYRQRLAYNGTRGTISEEQIKLLSAIGMRWDYIDLMDKWMEKYELAKAYYEHYGNLNMPRRFKTKNGIDYDKEGFSLEGWVSDQRSTYRGVKHDKTPLTQEQIGLLSAIGMRWDYIDKAGIWMQTYELAKAYYEHHGNLEVPDKFKTKDGITYDEEGYTLGQWVCAQRQAYRGANGRTPLTQEQIELLSAIGMRWDNIDKIGIWMQWYKLAQAYYEHHGNLEIPSSFKTINGYDKDEEGYKLGQWVNDQRKAYKGKGTRAPLTQEQIELLSAIGMRWDKIDKIGIWMQWYRLAQAYYEHHGNLEVPAKFKTKDGITYDEEGYTLGQWVSDQRKTYKGKGSRVSLTQEQIELLSAIGMRWDKIDLTDKWMQHYKLAKAYYEHHGDLEIPASFKTINGYDKDEEGFALGQWISDLRRLIKGQSRRAPLTQEQIELLNLIGMRWDNLSPKSK